MTTCALVLGVISCVVSGPRLTPTEAAAILAASVPPFAYVPPAPLGPIVVSTGSKPGAGPWDWPDPLPLRRLDGSLWTDPPMVYGLPPWSRHRCGYGCEPRHLAYRRSR